MSDKHIYFRELDGYRLSVICRTYSGYGWESEGPESAIFLEFNTGSRGMSLEWIDDSDQSTVFASFKSGEDVKKFLEEMKEM